MAKIYLRVIESNYFKSGVLITLLACLALWQGHLWAEKQIETAQEKTEKPRGGFEEPHEGEEPSEGIPHTGREPGKPEKEKPEKGGKKKPEKPEKPENQEEKPSEGKHQKPEEPKRPEGPQPPTQPGTWPDVYKKPPEEKPPEEPGKLRKFERATKKKEGDETADRMSFFLFRIFELWIHVLSGYGQEGYQRYEFLKWPYHNNRAGTVGWSKDAKPNWALDVKGTFQKEVSGINGPGAALKLRSPVFFSLGADHTRYLERRPGGNLDRLSFSKFTFNLQMPFTGVLWDIGAGGTILAGETTTPGALLSTSLDIFPARPLAIHLAASNSWMQKGGQIQDLSLDLGFYIKRFEIFAGYRTLITEGSPSLHGPRMGVGLWF